MGLLKRLAKAISRSARSKDSRAAPAAMPTTQPPNSERRYDVADGFQFPADDLICGWTFRATLQLRTPMRVIARHGEVHHGPAKPPVITEETWEGTWSPVTKSWRELGLDMDDFPPGMMSSEVGHIPVDGGDFRRFLLAVRGIVEGPQSVPFRLDALHEELKKPEWAAFCRALGGQRAIAARFFPAFLGTIKGLPKESQALMRKAKLVTPAAIAAVPDDVLLQIKGVGRAKLASIRAACSDAGDPRSEIVDQVER